MIWLGHTLKLSKFEQTCITRHTTDELIIENPKTRLSIYISTLCVFSTTNSSRRPRKFVYGLLVKSSILYYRSRRVHNKRSLALSAAAKKEKLPYRRPWLHKLVRDSLPKGTAHNGKRTEFWQNIKRSTAVCNVCVE